METLNASTARREIFHLLDQVNTHHHPIQIQGRLNAAVLVGQEDWNAIQETLYLMSIPGMHESIHSKPKTFRATNSEAKSKVSSPRRKT